MRLAIIGAGASGLVAGITAARKNNEVVIFERNKEALKKLLLTGNGRCNYKSNDNSLTNYHSFNDDLISEIINEDNLNKMNEFLESIGIVGKEKNNCYYPYSEKSYSIKSLLLKEALINNVSFCYETLIEKISKEGNGFLVNGKYFDKVIIATGSKCAPKTGSDGFSYDIAKSFGHNIISVNPSLMQLVSNLKIEELWSGIRCDVIVNHLENDEVKKEQKGELQLTNYGLSGICIFNLSRNIRIGLNEGKKEEVAINFLPWLSEDVNIFLDKRDKELPKRDLTELCDGFLDYKLTLAICKYLDIDHKKTYQDLTFEEKLLLGNALINFKVLIVDTKGYLESQTCSGGVDLKEINLKTMESKLVNNLHFCGEAIDLDGDCGGYNLTIAWITGLLAGDIND